MTQQSNNHLSGALTVPHLIAAAVERWSDNDLVVFDDQRLSYREADARSALLARQLLAAGVGKGARVGVLFPNSTEFVISWLAINRIGAVGVPLSTFSTAAELRQLIHHADLQGLILAPGFLKHDYVSRLEQALPSLCDADVQRLPEAPYLRRLWVWDETPPTWAAAPAGQGSEEPDLVSAEVLAAAEAAVHVSDMAAIIYTSGSTGEPKGVMHSQGSLLRQSIKQAVEKGYTAEDRIFSSMPFFWVGGLSYKLLPAMQAGATVMGCRSSGAGDILDFIERERVTMFLGWPHAGHALEVDPSFSSRDLGSVRGGYLFGALPLEERPASMEAVGNALGMTETAGPHTAGHLSPLREDMHGSFGWASDGMEYRVVDVDSGRDLAEGETGELWVRGNTLMMGLYKRDPSEVFTRDGWYPTRDLVYRRAGHLFFQGRCDDVVKIKGANVSPKEVEDTLTEVPDITQAIVSGVKRGGKTVLGAVLATNPGASVDLQSVREALRAKLSAYKVPTLYLTLPADQLPFRSSGKVDRRALLEQLEERGTQG